MANKRTLQDIVYSENRRGFVKKLGLAGIVAGAAAQSGFSQTTPAITDIDILNFALNLEYLEAEFYTIATTGASLSQSGDVSGTGSSGATTGGAKVNFTDTAVQVIATQLAMDEQNHVKLLRGALGAMAIAKPAIKLDALGFGFASQSEFLTLARIFEDIGVTAYAGAAPLIQDKNILGVAARVLAVEAEHAGNIRYQIARFGIATQALDGADHTPPPSGSKYFSTDSNSLAEVRTPQQVLALAYAANNKTSGGFFPSGVNGTLNMSGASANTDGLGFSASPNPIPVTGNASVGMTTISWSAPSAQVIQVRVNSPTGGLLTNNANSGSMETGPWVTDGTVFYLQDVTGGKALTSANTLATLVVHLQRS